HVAGNLVPPGPAKNAHRRFGAASAHQTGDADDLAGADVEVHILEKLPVAMVLVKDVPVLHFEKNVADPWFAARIAVFHVTADHALDDAVLADVSTMTVERFDRAAIAQDGDLVGNLADLVELVGDDD